MIVKTGANWRLSERIVNGKHYQLIALAILIGAPLLVHGLTQYLPHESAVADAPVDNQAAPETGPTTSALAGLPHELPPPPTQARDPLRGGAMLDTTAALSVEGVAVAGTDPSGPGAVPSPAPTPAAAAPAVTAQAVTVPAAAEPPSGYQPTVTYVSPPAGGGPPPFREGLMRQGR